MGEDFRARDPALAKAEPGSLGPPGFDPAREQVVEWRDYGWEQTFNHPLVNQAFAWADETGVGRGSGAYGYFVRAFIAGAVAASGMEARQGGDVKRAPSRSDDSPTAKGGDAQKPGDR